MNKSYCIFIVTMISAFSYSQSYFIRSGKNSSQFKYSNSYATTILKSDIGDSYEVGHSYNIGGTKMEYEIALQLNKYSPYVGSPESEVRYSLHYLGIDNAILYPIIGTSPNSKFKLKLKAGLSCNKLISGIESIEGEIHDVKNFPEFKGFLFMGELGLQSVLEVNKNINLSLGYNYGRSFINTGQLKSETLTISRSQFLLGINFILLNN